MNDKVFHAICYTIAWMILYSVGALFVLAGSALLMLFYTGGYWEQAWPCLVLYTGLFVVYCLVEVTILRVRRRHRAETKQGE